MAIIRWEPFRELVSTQDEFNRVFNDVLGRFFEETGQSERGWNPAVDLYETDQNVVLKAELPGIEAKDVEIRVEGGTLYLSGERKFEQEVKKGGYQRVERSYGAFSRAFSLPTSVDPDQAKAEYSDGVLTLTLPKNEEAKPKSIKIVTH